MTADDGERFKYAGWEPALDSMRCARGPVASNAQAGELDLNRRSAAAEDPAAACNHEA